MTPSGAAPVRIWGLAKIARALGVGLATLKRWMARPAGERPPVRHCHRGWYALESRLHDWVDAEDMDGGVHMELAKCRPKSAAENGPTRAA